MNQVKNDSLTATTTTTTTTTPNATYIQENGLKKKVYPIKQKSTNSLHSLSNQQNAFPLLNKTNQVQKQEAIIVESRLVFLKLGQIDTRNERYDAEAYIECSWHDDRMFELLINTVNQHAKQTDFTQQHKRILACLQTIEYDPSLHWSPQLYIENAIGDLKEEIRYKLEIVNKRKEMAQGKLAASAKVATQLQNLTVQVCEMRKVRGVFYERLELYDFPMDIQELSMTLTSKKSKTEVSIVENTQNPCSINTEEFLDQQEWDLFSHVKTSPKYIHDPWRKYDRSAFSVTGFIARKPGYYLYNAYMLIFLITVLGFVPFAFSPDGPQFRAQTTGLLLLTSVNFRWIVTQRLPSVPYLTSLDKYAIGSLLFLVSFCVWHSLIGSSIITNSNDNRRAIDNYVLYAFALLVFIHNLCYVLWFIKMGRTIRKVRDEGASSLALNINNDNNNTNNQAAGKDNVHNLNLIKEVPLNGINSIHIASATTTNFENNNSNNSTTNGQFKITNRQRNIGTVAQSINNDATLLMQPHY